MAINPNFFPSKPAIASRGQLLKRVTQAQFSLPAEEPHPVVSMERATKEFGLALQQLSTADRQEIQKIQLKIDQKHPNNSPERFGRFLVGVMDYSHRRLSFLEQNRDLAQPGECERYEKVFTSGANLVEAFAALE